MPWLRIGSLDHWWTGSPEIVLPTYNSFVNGTWPARVIHLLLKTELSPMPALGYYYSVNSGVYKCTRLTGLIATLMGSWHELEATNKPTRLAFRRLFGG